jgi:hypothetical protein
MFIQTYVLFKVFISFFVHHYRLCSGLFQNADSIYTKDDQHFRQVGIMKHIIYWYGLQHSNINYHNLTHNLTYLINMKLGPAFALQEN